jgi:hypothetical protein
VGADAANCVPELRTTVIQFLWRLNRTSNPHTLGRRVVFLRERGGRFLLRRLRYVCGLRGFRLRVFRLAQLCIASNRCGNRE